jgi:hypothetical protein
MKASQADIPSELSFPILLSATYQHLILNLVDLDVFLKDRFLVYVIRLPLTNHVNYNVYHVLPLPTKIRDTDSRFTFIFPDREYLLMDVAKQYYAQLRADELKECKLVSPYHRVCKQNHPIQLVHVHEECEVDMLQSIRTIPSSCSQRISEINQTIWTQLDENKWLYVAPRTDTHGSVCQPRTTRPRDIRDR